MSTEEVVDSTSTRALIDIPNPATSLSVGEFSTDSGYNGVSVDTVEHVRFYGKGGTSASDLVGQATGQVWLQSMNHVVGLSKENLMIASRDRTQIVAQKGVTILAGYSGGDVTTEPQAGTLPTSVTSFDSSAQIAAGIATGINAAEMVVAAVLTSVMSVASSRFSWTTAMSGVTANLTGAALNIASLGWSKDIDLPGINLFSSGFFTVGSAKSTVNLIGLAGVLISSSFVSLAGLFTTKITGGFHTAMNAIGPVDLLAGDRVTIRGWFGVEVASRTGSFTGRGKKINLGSPIPFVKSPQVNTLNVKMQALKSITLSSLINTSVSAYVSYASTAMDHEIEATIGTKLNVGNGLWTLEVNQLGMKAKGPAATLEVDASGVTLSGPGGAAKAEFAIGKVDLSCGAGSIKIVPGASIAFDGMKLDFK